MNVNIQQAILASFLWSNDLNMNTKNAFILNPHFFTKDRYLIASKINEVTNTEDKFYGLLNLELENISSQEWLNISTQTPLPLSYARKLHDSQIDPRGGAV